MRRTITILAAAAALAAAAFTPGAVVAGDGQLSPRVVATFPIGYDYGSFAESVAIDRAGNLFVSVTIWTDGEWNRGQLWKISPNGRMQQLGPDLDVGILTGLALDRDGSLYAGLVTFDVGGVRSGILRFDAAGGATRVATMHPGTFPNGLAIHDGYLYVSDSYKGMVWRAELGRPDDQLLLKPWLKDPTLAVASAEGWEGVNGIAFWGDTLYAVNADTGNVVRVPVRANGAPDAPVIAAGDPALVGADGIAFDEEGGLWIVVNHGDEDAGGALLRMSPTGNLRVVANDPGWLDYPSQPAFGNRRGDATTLYVVNGSFNTGNCNVIALNVGVRGQPLP